MKYINDDGSHSLDECERLGCDLEMRDAAQAVCDLANDLEDAFTTPRES